MAFGFLAVFWVAIGGALGGMGRLAVGDLIGRWVGTRFPWGTLVVNLSGALAMGVLAGSLGLPTPSGDGPGWQFAAIGLLGGYTTVSSFSLQTLALWQQGRRFMAVANVTVTLVAGFMALGVGWWLAGGSA
ncbi:CrcB family protein [Halomonas sp.]|jgi:CrcB protein|uniref:fluoride efflux transporter FluC n=1 Tax=Halomonas sp. TaxID=1486246 RepID=UPI00356374EB